MNMHALEEFMERWERDDDFHVRYHQHPEEVVDELHFQGEDRDLLLKMSKLPDDVLEERISKMLFRGF